MRFGEDLEVREASSSAGRFLVFELPLVEVVDPEAQTWSASSGLTRAETEQLRDELNEILERW